MNKFMVRYHMKALPFSVVLFLLPYFRKDGDEMSNYKNLQMKKLNKLLR